VIPFFRSTPLLSAPILLGLSLHRWRFRVLELQPVLRAAGAVTRAETLRHDALATEFAGVPKYALAIMSKVLDEPQPRKASAQ